MTQYLGIEIDYERDKLIPEQGLVMLTKKGFYKRDWENSPQEGFARAATCYCFGDYELAQRIYDYVSKGWFTFASPVLSNAIDIKWPVGLPFDIASDWLEENKSDEVDGMPISCFLNYIDDTKESLVKNSTETRWLSMNGGGVGTFYGQRSPDEKSTGVMAHAKTYDADTVAYRQTASRRGSMAGYLDITHPEIMSFIDMRNPMSGGDSNTRCMNLNHGVNITDDFMHKMINNEKFELVDPKHGNTGRFLSAQEVWNKLMDVRFETGEPYLNFIDTVNRNIPKWIMNPLYKVVQSNLCTEITLMTSAKRTAVCCLSSVNLEKYDEWKDSNMVGDLIRLLDNVLEYFIRLAPEELERAVYSARKERALGLGTLGFHAYLQSKSIPFESGGFNSAVQHTHMIYSSIKAKAVEESKRLAKERGEPSDTRGSGMRNSHLLAIAPNASSSSLINTSPSAEPWAANAFNAGGRAGAFLIKNRYLEALLELKGMNTPDVWKSIVLKDGSVQHLDFLSDIEKAIYKTSFEIDQTWVVELASIRQQYLCQAQSINLFMPPGTTAQYMSDIHVQAWIKGVKSLYYLRSDAPVKAIVDRALIKARRVSLAPEVCVACEG
jgi:ribonucleoside-diphosphate reductase alpha chain